MIASKMYYLQSTRDNFVLDETHFNHYKAAYTATHIDIEDNFVISRYCNPYCIS